MYNWLQLFKAMAFVPIDYLSYAWSFVLQRKPVFKELDAFDNYFYDTWLNNPNYPSSLWNQFRNSTDRTNNKIEGSNNGLSVEVDVNKPNIFACIESLQHVERTAMLHYLDRKNNNAPRKRKRGEYYVQRDTKLANLFEAFAHNLISIDSYIYRTAHLYSYGPSSNKTNLLPSKPKAIFQVKSSLLDIHVKSFNFISDYILHN